MTSTDVEVRASNSLARSDELSVEDLVHQVAKIQQAMSAVMKEDEHYGVIPGTGKKPSLLKPGAEKLCLLFRFDPEYETTERWDGEHLFVTAKCTLYHIPTGNRVASGMGMCSTREAKYAYRNAKRTCPVCGVEAIIKGKAEYGGGWVCFKKQDGCGTKFPDGDDRIEKQTVGRVANPDLPDQYNTVVKMAAKRALIAATLNGTAASDLFTQDLEDLNAATPEVEMPRDGGDGIEDAVLEGTPFSESQFQPPKPTEAWTRATKAMWATISELVDAGLAKEDELKTEIYATYGVTSTKQLKLDEVKAVTAALKLRKTV